jgi:hypothetical protein
VLAHQPAVAKLAIHGRLSESELLVIARGDHRLCVDEVFRTVLPRGDPAPLLVDAKPKDCSPVLTMVTCPLDGPDRQHVRTLVGRPNRETDLVSG